jgi:hypothetical protein
MSAVFGTEYRGAAEWRLRTLAHKEIGIIPDIKFRLRNCLLERNLVWAERTWQR